MRMIYFGPLWPGSTALQRAKGFQHCSGDDPPPAEAEANCFFQYTGQPVSATYWFGLTSLHKIWSGLYGLKWERL